MHELFLTAHLADENVSRATRILQGYCEMAPVSMLNRRLVWDAPRGKAKGFDPAFTTRQPTMKLPLWRSLQDQLARQPYIVTLLYAVTRDQFGTPDEPIESSEEKKPTLDELPGSIYWADLPDPGSARPVNSRNAVSIENETGLCKNLRFMGYRFSKEVIQEGYRFIHGNVIIILCHYLEIPTNLREKEENSQPTISLPRFELLVPFDSQDKWILTARVEVLNVNDPEQMQRGTDELMSIKEAFEGCFDFQMMDRHTFDTRVKF